MVSTKTKLEITTKVGINIKIPSKKFILIENCNNRHCWRERIATASETPLATNMVYPTNNYYIITCINLFRPYGPMSFFDFGPMATFLTCLAAGYRLGFGRCTIIAGWSWCRGTKNKSSRCKNN